MSQAVKTIVDRQHLVTLQDPDSDGRTYGSVHAGARSSHVHEGDVDVALFMEEIIRLNVSVLGGRNLVPLFRGGARERASCRCSSCSRSSYFSRDTLEYVTQTTPQALKEMNKSTSHFPLSLIASSNLPSAMAVVTSLVWGVGQRRRVAGSKP